LLDCLIQEQREEGIGWRLAEYFSRLRERARFVAGKLPGCNVARIVSS